MISDQWSVIGDQWSKRVGSLRSQELFHCLEEHCLSPPVALSGHFLQIYHRRLLKKQHEVTTLPGADGLAKSHGSG
jgi:hypothetical protein